MVYREILVETCGRVGILTLNRPDMLNAVNTTMAEEIGKQLEQWETDDDIGVIILTGAGRAFCSGADIANFEQRISGETPKPNPVSASWISRLRTFPKPTICAINGVAVGLGLTCSLLCDIRLATPEAKLSFRFVRLGLTPEAGSTHFLPRIVGLERASELMFTGRFFTGYEAKKMELVLAVHSPDELLEKALEIGQNIAEAPSWHLSETKRMLREHPITYDFSAIEKQETSIFGKAMNTPEHREAIVAFRGKRKPNFH